jgi:hypothetical protein
LLKKRYHEVDGHVTSTVSDSWEPQIRLPLYSYKQEGCNTPLAVSRSAPLSSLPLLLPLELFATSPTPRILAPAAAS